MIDTHICVNPSGKLVSDQGSQTIYSKYELSAKAGRKYGFEKRRLYNCKIPLFQSGGGGGVLIYMGYIGMCRPIGYGF